MAQDIRLSLEDRSALQDLKARYFRCVDTKDWATFETLFAPDATLSPIDDLPGTTFAGAACISESVSKSMHDVLSVHHGFTPEFSLVSADDAEGIWPMEDLLWFGPASSVPGLIFHGFGHYHERYVCIGGEWRFHTVELRRVRVETRMADS